MDSVQEGKHAMCAVLCDGSAYSAFQTMLKMQGVSPALVDHLADWLPRAAFTTLLYCPTAGPFAPLVKKKFVNVSNIVSYYEYRHVATKTYLLCSDFGKCIDKILSIHRVPFTLTLDFVLFQHANYTYK